MTRNQKAKGLFAMAVVSYGTQAALLRPGEGIWHVLALGTAGLVATLALFAVAAWIAKP